MFGIEILAFFSYPPALHAKLESRPPSEGGQDGTQAMIRLLFFALYAIQTDFCPQTGWHWNSAESPRSSIISPFEGGLGDEFSHTGRSWTETDHWR